MPFYEYECPACKYYLEVLQKISDKPLKKCPSCGKAGFKRLVSAPVFRLKGSGWYETDFKSDKDSQRNLAGADREETKAASDDKPAVPAGSKADTPADTPADTKAGGDAAKPAADKARPESAAPAAKADKPAASRRTAPKRTPKPPARPAGRNARRPAARGARRR